MVLKANKSVSVCDTGLHFTEDTHGGPSASQSDPRRQPSPNQLTFDPSGTTWIPRVTVSQLKDNVHHALSRLTGGVMSVGICPLWKMMEQWSIMSPSNAGQEILL